MPLSYPVLKEQAEIVQINLTMCNDEAPTVKRYASANFEHFFPVLQKDRIFTPVPGAEQSLMQKYCVSRISAWRRTTQNTPSDARASMAP